MSSYKKAAYFYIKNTVERDYLVLVYLEEHSLCIFCTRLSIFSHFELFFFFTVKWDIYTILIELSKQQEYFSKNLNCVWALRLCNFIFLFKFKLCECSQVVNIQRISWKTIFLRSRNVLPFTMFTSHNKPFLLQDPDNSPSFIIFNNLKVCLLSLFV